MNDNYCLTKEDCIKRLSGLKLYVFGICRESDEILKELGNTLDIVAFVDNFKCGEDSVYNGLRIISPQQFIAERNPNMPILVSTARYVKSIVNQLMDLGLICGKDIFVWDNHCLFHSDESLEEFKCYFESIWAKEKQIETSQTVLIPIDNCHEMSIVRYAYVANYFACKNKASIYAYCRYGFAKENLSTSIMDIYRSFNTVDVIETGLCESLENEAVEIANELWKKLNTLDDWKNIKIYGIHFGTTMMRDYFRRFLYPGDVKDTKMFDYLLTSVRTIVFWYRYFENNRVCAVLMADGTNWDGFIRDIAISKGVATYNIGGKMRRLTLDYAENSMYQYFDRMWDQLTLEEQEFGKNWAKDRIESRLKGNTQDVALVDKKNFVFAVKNSDKRILSENDKLKVMICPHSFEEDCYWYGEHIFADNYYSWLYHLGELSLRTPEYDWYLKEHPAATKRDIIIINQFLEKYRNIKRIPAKVSPIQLKKEGIEFAFTECGTIGHEYPQIGIQVINAGKNPHSKFDFCWNPETKEEFDNLVLNLKNVTPKSDEEGILKFYALKYLFYNWDAIPYKTFFFDNEILTLSKKDLIARGYEPGTWIYKMYLDAITDEKHENRWNNVESLIKTIDSWRPNILYKNEIKFS